MVAKVRLEHTIYLSKIYINDILHVSFPTGRCTLQSWKDDRCYSIEIMFPDMPPLKLEYDNQELWKDILAVLDKTISNQYLGSH